MVGISQLTCVYYPYRLSVTRFGLFVYRQGLHSFDRSRSLRCFSPLNNQRLTTTQQCLAESPPVRHLRRHAGRQHSPLHLGVLAPLLHRLRSPKNQQNQHHPPLCVEMCACSLRMLSARLPVTESSLCACASSKSFAVVSHQRRITRERTKNLKRH